MERTSEHALDEIDEMIVQEKKQVAFEYQSDAWADGVADGIEPEIIADAALGLAMRETIKLLGEEGAEELLETLKQRILTGEFSPERILQ